MNDLYKKQEITLRDRTMLKITGIGEVSSFAEVGIVLASVNGDISVDGSDLKIVSLSSETGEIEISGRVNGVFYIEERPKKKLFGRRA